jgi:hypothetical protein
LPIEAILGDDKDGTRRPSMIHNRRRQANGTTRDPTGTVSPICRYRQDDSIAPLRSPAGANSSDAAASQRHRSME